MRGIVYQDDLGQKCETPEIPAELAEQAQEYHHQLIDSIAEFDDELTETYLLDEESVTPDMIRRALRRGTLANKITPVLLGSAFKNKGVQPLLDAVIDYLPSPLDVPPVHGIDPRTEHELSRRPANDEPFSALAFKVMSDPYVGKLTYFRVYSGRIKAGERVLNTTTGKTERISRILQMHANHREEREEITAGEIAAGVGLKFTTTGDTLAADNAPIILERMTFPEPRQPGEGYEFSDKITGGKIPKEYIPAVDAGIKEAMDSGVLAGYPVVDVGIELVDGSYHEVDSSERAFKIAGSMAFKEAMKRAKAKLLEPVMAVEVVTPEAYLGDVMGNISSRRGRVENMEQRGNARVVRARVPLAEMFGYATDLRSTTQGRATFTMQFDRYEEVPQSIAGEIVDASTTS